MIYFNEKHFMSENISFQVVVYIIVHNDFRNDHFYYNIEGIFTFKIKYHYTLDVTSHGEYHLKLY